MADDSNGNAFVSGRLDENNDHRRQVLETLASICRGMARMQTSQPARAACLDVAVFLDREAGRAIPAVKRRRSR